ncbi:hypothetical protein Tco_1012078, partial [Tanacetum coccineum]
AATFTSYATPQPPHHRHPSPSPARHLPTTNPTIATPTTSSSPPSPPRHSHAITTPSRHHLHLHLHHTDHIPPPSTPPAAATP